MFNHGNLHIAHLLDVSPGMAGIDASCPWPSMYSSLEDMALYLLTLENLLRPSVYLSRHLKSRVLG